ncbi:hypothetical protein [Trichocoleus sp. DQ-U1]|uniref:hypothetical protein n=1 Tax=Trichocoleus sp. DQ-U1 TaxID=2933926 RepID=UPI003297B2A9
MDECDAILRQGIFNEIFTDSRRSISENLLEWLKTTDFGTFQGKQGGGLKVGFPIKGVPFELGGSFSEGEFKEWQRAVEEGRVRQFDDSELKQILSRSASDTIVAAWSKCIRERGFGLISSIDVNDEDIVFTARYVPNSETDTSPTVEGKDGFHVTGATILRGFSDGDKIPFGGRSAILRRTGREQVTIVLTTTKGELRETLPQLPDLPPPETVIRLECLGDISGPRLLDGRTGDGTVGLVDNPAFSGTRWKVHEIGAGVIQLECLGDIPGPKLLDGRTGDGTVGLIASTSFSGTKWKVNELSSGVVQMECLGDIPGPRFLDGRTGDGTVGLVDNPDNPGFSGTRWRIIS